LKVRNEDVVLDRGGPGHEIRLVVDPGNCPPAIVSAGPDFVPRTPGAQDVILVRAGKRKSATLVLGVAAADFFSPDRATPARCELTVRALGPGADPVPANDTTTIVLEVFDAND
jgi:hypothetical protein